MITLYTAPGPNGHKISVALEELALPYRVEVVDVFGGGITADFLKLNPNGKIPVIADDETGQTVFESGAILLYLAEKTGRLIPAEPAGRFDVIQWLFFQVASIGPMFGQRAHFERFAPESVPYAITRYQNEVARLVDVLDARLAGRDYICDSYSIADIALLGWMNPARKLGFVPPEKTRIEAWFARLLARPAVQKGLTVPALLPF